MNALAFPTTVADIVDEYAVKSAAVAEAIAECEAAIHRMQAASVVQGVYVETVVNNVFINERAVKTNLRKSGWKAIYRRLDIDRIASARDRRLFEQTLANPPELTFENAKATFGDYLLRPRFHQLRALAEVFVQLDPAYKSHSKVKIGVAGLPKRIILSNVGGYGSYGRDRLRDVLNALAAIQGLPLVDDNELARLNEGVMGHKAGEVAFDGSPLKTYRNGKDGEWLPPDRGVTVRKFQNGNGHVIFAPETLLAINLALAEFYGDVLPDAEDDEPKAKRASTNVARDLQFYPTPRAVIDRVLDDIGLVNRRAFSYDALPDKHVLEPSCGDGRIMDVIKARGHRVTGIEIHAGRAAEARAKGHAVIIGNFLEQPTRTMFDFVVMNPPFSGRHWKLHLAKAREFLAPGGMLACILPASAWYDSNDLRDAGTWHDLPVASFAESGTNIPTGYILIGAIR